MIDEHSLSELIYIGPKALVALKNALEDRCGHEVYEDEEGHWDVGGEMLADMLLGLASTGHLRITVVTQNSAMESEECVVGSEEFFDNHITIPAKRAELVWRLAGEACVYATVINEDARVEKGGAR